MVARGIDHRVGGAAAALGRPGFAFDRAADRSSWAAMTELFGEAFIPA
ncbi:MAG TPA: hypothetical protein VIB82_03080 [Caulobacteraceae bacterium]